MKFEELVKELGIDITSIDAEKLKDIDSRIKSDVLGSLDLKSEQPEAIKNFVNEEVRKAEQITKDQLYGKINKSEQKIKEFEHEVEKIKKEKEGLEEKIKSSRNKNEANNQTEDNGKGTMKEIEEARKEMEERILAEKDAMKASLAEMEKRMEESRKESRIQTAKSLLREMVASAGGKEVLIEDMLPNVESNPDITEDEIRSAVEKAKNKMTELRDRFEEDVKTKKSEGKGKESNFNTPDADMRRKQEFEEAVEKASSREEVKSIYAKYFAEL